MDQSGSWRALKPLSRGKLTLERSREKAFRERGQSRRRICTGDMELAYRNKTYIAFDGDNDMSYYRLMTAWAANETFDFSIYDAHDVNSARDTSYEESIKKQLRERFANSKLFMVLIGANTRFLTKFVKWEIETAIRLDLPIIAVNLNKARGQDNLCPPSLKAALAIYVPFSEKMINFALDSWPSNHAVHRKARKSGPFHYKDSVYQNLGVK
jgi:hypothetical protein